MNNKKYIDQPIKQKNQLDTIHDDVLDNLISSYTGQNHKPEVKEAIFKKIRDVKKQKREHTRLANLYRDSVKSNNRESFDYAMTKLKNIYGSGTYTHNELNSIWEKARATLGHTDKGNS